MAAEVNPFPSVCGWICTAPCETACRRGTLDEPISIRTLKRFAAGVDRSVIERGAEMLGLSIDDLIAGTIAGMREVAADIGLAGAANGAA